MACPSLRSNLEEIKKIIVRTARLDPYIVMDKEKERIVDVVMYLACLSMSAFRFARGENPFDFESLAVAEFISARTLPFIENENVDYRKAHKDFIQTMVENGWSHGVEDFVNRTHPDITDWDNLTMEAKQIYGYFAGIVCSARGFYQSLKNELEEEFMNSFSSMIIKEKTFVGQRDSGSTH